MHFEKKLKTEDLKSPVKYVKKMKTASCAGSPNVLPAPFYKAAVEILDTISGVVYPKVLHLGEQLLTKIKWNHYSFGRS